MKKNEICLLIVIFLVVFLSNFACSVGSGEDPPYEEETHYKAGASVASLPYKDVQSIDLYIRDDLTESFKKVRNGEFVRPGVHTVGVKVTSRVIGDEALEQRVFVSDGGYIDQTEAFFDEATGYYVCDFEFTTTYLTHPVLIQVVYPDATASKEKFVVNTIKGSRPDSGVLVQNGMGITVGSDILAGFDTLLEGMLGDMLGFKVEVEDFSPADNREGHDEGVLHLNLKNLLDGDMVINDLRGSKRGLNIEFEDLSLLGENAFGKMMGNFIGPILQLSLGSLGFDLSEMLAGLGGDDDGGEDDMMATLLGNLELDKTLLLNIHGIAEYTTPDFAALGGGLFAYDTSDLELDKDGEALWPEVEVDGKLPAMDLSGLTAHEDFNINVALTQYNLNQMLGDMMNGFKATIDAKALDLPFITPENPGDPMTIEITVNPGGIAIDFNYRKDPPVALIAANDLRLVFVEAGYPMAELSADLTLEMAINIRTDEEGYFLDLSVEPVEDLSHVHVLKDNKGLGLFDHARIVKTIFNALSDSEGDEPFMISLNLTDFGLSPKTRVKETGKVSFDGNGNCFLSLAVDSVDPVQLLGDDACFISSALFEQSSE